MNTEPWQRIVIHADMDAFFAAVEQLDNPAYRGKPLLIGGRSERSVVSTASYEARRFGAKSAMAMVKALQLCPHAIVVEPRMGRYKEISSIIMDVFSQFSPQVEPLSVDEAFMEMTGAEKIFGSPTEMGRAIKKAVYTATGGLTISVGVAATKFMAKVASDMDKPDGLTVIEPGTECDTLWPMDVSRIWGVGPKTRERLQQMGLRTVKDVATSNREWLESKMGKQGSHIWLLANNIDARDVHPREEAKSVGKEYTLSEDISGAENIWPHLRRCADRIARSLRKEGLRAKGVRVKLKTAQFDLLTRQGSTEQLTDNAKELLAAAAPLLEKFDLSRKYRLVGMAAFQLIECGGQEELFVGEEVKRRHRLDKAFDEVLQKFGDAALSRGEELE
ncbi:MAG: DNA polymerase IV [Deltaproteobacteria bacterium]|nr:DNA polymerase IV [Deltaproteobacteria bacterium]MBN2674031.1 DNA polymerase IV [Deltaproteobacteria bacterium]